MPVASSIIKIKHKIYFYASKLKFLIKEKNGKGFIYKFYVNSLVNTVSITFILFFFLYYVTSVAFFFFTKLYRPSQVPSSLSCVLYRYNLFVCLFVCTITWKCLGGTAVDLIECWLARQNFKLCYPLLCLELQTINYIREESIVLFLLKIILRYVGTHCFRRNM